MQSDPILERVERHLAETGQTPTRFGQDVLGDPNLVFQLRQGRELRRQTRERVTAFLDAESNSEAA